MTSSLLHRLNLLTLWIVGTRASWEQDGRMCHQPTATGSHTLRTRGRRRVRTGFVMMVNIRHQINEMNEITLYVDHCDNMCDCSDAV